MPRVTVFTPTFNRAKLLRRVHDSLLAQTCDNFEWLVIDDGSSDDTQSVVRAMSEGSKLPIRYYRRPNRGKVASINEALDLAEGEFFLVFDSDDWCSPNAIERFLTVWDELGDSQSDYCAVSCLKREAGGGLVGEDYSRMARLGETYVDRFNRRIRGDKWEFIRTDVHRLHRYQLGPGEKYQAPEFAWLGMGSRFKTVFIDEALGIIEYQSDGISRNNLKHRAASPLSATNFYMRGFELAVGWKNRARMAINAVRFTLHANGYCGRHAIPRYAFPVGWIAYSLDRVRLAGRRSGREVLGRAAR